MSDKAKLNAKDLRDKSDGELNQLLIDLRKEQFGLNMSKGSGQEVKVHQFNQVRRNIARVKTVLNNLPSSN
ncbi:MAG: 50S ribosomal protein L29 [Pseudomonadota bacterium]